jgi:bifunctional non-homologous end joining protein LigD
MPWRKPSVKGGFGSGSFQIYAGACIQTLALVEPIVPTARPQPFNDPAWLFKPKYDGFRGVLYLTRRSCTLYSKRGNAMTRFGDLAEQLEAELPGREVILDGEIVALDDEGRISFWDLMHGRGTLALCGVRRALAQREGSPRPSAH